MRRLFEALADLDDCGGVAALADDELWPEAKVSRVVSNMTLIRRMLQAEVSQLRDKTDASDGPASE